MSKIVTAVNSMLSNSEKITNVIGGESTPSELFFLYDNKYVWSVNKYGNDYWICYYPGSVSVDELASTYDWDTVSMVSYSTKDIVGREALETFSDLYMLVNEKLFGVDDVLNDIISGMQ